MLIENILDKSGLPIQVTDNGLTFSRKIGEVFFQEKDYKSFRQFFHNKSLDIDIVLYYIYRRVSFIRDIKLFEKNNLRYDLTFIFADVIDNEIIHTVGHFHKKSKGGISYPEIYQVIDGLALFLLQKKDNKKFYAIEAKAGDTVIVPPDFGHITVNISNNSPLLIANIFTSDNDVSDYTVFKKNGGSMWYPIRKEGVLSLIKNSSYKNYIKIEHLKANKIRNIFNLTNNILYLSFIDNPEKFEFLNNPEKFLDKLSIDKLFDV